VGARKTSRVYFLIGLHKTASSWLQTRLFPNLTNVKLLTTRALDQLRLPCGVATVIVSNEGLSGALAPKRPGERTARLERHLKQIESLAPERAIIVRFRKHQSWLQSGLRPEGKKNWTIFQGELCGFLLFARPTMVRNAQTS
jgi:hypothetical protein